MTDRLDDEPHVTHAQALQTTSTRKGLLKCRLVHMPDRSFVLPDVLMASGTEKVFYSPSFFHPNAIAFWGGSGRSDLCRFTMQVGEKIDLQIAFFRRDLVKQCSDGSFIYKCAFKVVGDKAMLVPEGKWRVTGDRFDLRLYHHTNVAGRDGIHSSNEIWSSSWNIQGNQRLENIGYGYFTSVPKIRWEGDLLQVAMSSQGRAHFITTNAPYYPQFAHPVAVPQRVAADLGEALCFWVDVETIAPSHVWLHRPWAQPAYYEVVLPKVFRVGVAPGSVLPFKENTLRVDPATAKSFQYVIVGDADTPDGLAAPYNEEHTLHTAKIDIIPGGMEIIGRWWEKQNTQMFDDMDIEMARVERKPNYALADPLKS